MEIYSEENISSQQNFMDFATTQGSGININDSMYKEATLTKEQFIAKIVILSTFPVLLVFGTIGNVLTFIVMQRGTLKHSSTCFYMAMLAVADSCKYDYIHRGNVLTFIVMQRGTLKHSSTCFNMAMLAVADSCKYGYIHRGNVLTFIVMQRGEH